ncbi:MAG TPA: DUF2807 domain-containing protein, partial [Fimbriimonas sp.]|nr:DUF2807 domain-containing protein [Fimbriimonas sp.]
SPVVGFLAMAFLLGGCTVKVHSSDDSITFDAGPSNGSLKGITIETHGMGPQITAEGEATEETRNVPSFHGIDAGSVFRVEYTTGAEAPIKISAQKNVLQHIKTSVKDGVLSLDLDGNFRELKPIVVTISNPHLDDLTVSGAANFKGAGLSESRMKLDISGGSEVTLDGRVGDLNAQLSGAGILHGDALQQTSLKGDLSGGATATLMGTPNLVDVTVGGGSKLSVANVSATRVKLELSGGGQADLKGTTDSLDVSCDGGSTADLSELVAQSAKTEANGGSQIRLDVRKALVANANGAGNITYKGNPGSVTKSAEGASNIGPD